MYRKYPNPKYLWHWEDVFLILFTMTLPMQNLGIIKSFTFAKIFAMLGFAYLMVRGFLRRDMWILLLNFKSPTSLVILFFCFVNMASGFNMRDSMYFSGFVSRYLSLFNIVIFYGYIMKQKRHLLYAVIAAMLIGSFPNTVAGLYELATKKMVLKGVAQGTATNQMLMGRSTQLQGSQGGRRILGFDGGPGEHAIHFVVFTGLSAILPFVARTFWVRSLGLLLVLLNMVNVMGTGSRTGMIGLFLCVVCFFVFIEVRRKALLIAAFVAGVVLAVFVFDLPMARLLGKTGTTRVTQNFRVEQYRTALNMIEKHPILGIGAGNFIPLYSSYQWNFPQHDETWSIGPMHNAILNQLTEGGILGLLALFLMLSVVLYKQYLVRVQSPDPTLRVIAVGLMSAFIGWCGGLMFYPSLADEQGWILMGITIGLWAIHQGVLRDAKASPEGVQTA